MIVHVWADQSLPPLLMEKFDTFPQNTSALDICMMNFNCEKLIIDKKQLFSSVCV